MSDTRTAAKERILRALLLTALVPVLLVYAAAYTLVYLLLWGLILSLAAWIVWGVRRRHILFVYSDSTIWKEYIEAYILPHIRERAVLLNWSQRSRWDEKSLPVLIFRRFGGDRDFNPMAVVLRPLRFPKVIRFYSAFREFKHGRADAVENLTAELFRAAGVGPAP